MAIIPLNKKVLLKPLISKEKKTSGGILLAEEHSYEVPRGEVVSLGDKVELKISEGDIVIFNSMGSEKVEDFIILDENKIIALVR